jgi:hypothetical protein
VEYVRLEQEYAGRQKVAAPAPRPHSSGRNAVVVVDAGVHQVFAWHAVTTHEKSCIERRSAPLSDAMAQIDPEELVNDNR